MTKAQADIMEKLYDKQGVSKFHINEVVYILHERKIKQLTKTIDNLLQRINALERIAWRQGIYNE